MSKMQVRKWIDKRIVIGITSGALLAAFVGQPSLPAKAADTATTNDGLSVNLPSAILIDANSGQVLWAKNENEEREPASTTKLMTLYLTEKAISEGKVKKTDIVPITDKAYQLTQGDSSSGWLNPNEKLTLDTMLSLICVPSGNDAAEAVSEFLAGDESTFVKQMNDEAQALGLTHTHYLDSHGLTEDPNHHTTARDLAVLARDLVMTYPDILNYTSQQSFEVKDDFRKDMHLKPFQNTNLLLGKYPGMDGLKTGYTDKAGHCLVATAKRGDMRLIAVELGAASEQLRQSETTKLLDYGFSNFTEQKLVTKGETAPTAAPIQKGVSETVPAVAASDVLIAVKKGSAAPTKNVTFQPVVAPVKAGQKVGQIQLVQNGQVIASTDLVAQTADDKASWIRLFFRSILHGITGLFHKI